MYPVTAPEMKGVNVLVQDGKIAEIGAKLAPPKGVRVIDIKGLRVYPGMIDSGTELGLSEVPAERVTVDTGEIGEFMPQLRALIAVNPDSEHFPVVRVNGITSVMTFPSSGGRGGGGGRVRRRRAAIHRRAGGADPHRRLDVGRDGDRPQRGDALDFPDAGPVGRTRQFRQRHDWR